MKKTDANQEKIDKRESLGLSISACKASDHITLNNPFNQHKVKKIEMKKKYNIKVNTIFTIIMIVIDVLLLLSLGFGLF